MKWIELNTKLTDALIVKKPMKLVKAGVTERQHGISVIIIMMIYLKALTRTANDPNTKMSR